MNDDKDNPISKPRTGAELDYIAKITQGGEKSKWGQKLALMYETFSDLITDLEDEGFTIEIKIRPKVYEEYRSK